MPGTLPGAMPSDEALRSLSDEQLSSLEGMERANVEARIALLRNVQRLLDAAVTQLNQYSAVMAALGSVDGVCVCEHFIKAPGYMYVFVTPTVQELVLGFQVSRLHLLETRPPAVPPLPNRLAYSSRHRTLKSVEQLNH